MGATASVQALPARVSKAGAKAVAGALFDSEAFAQQQGEDGLVAKSVVLGIAQERKITHEALMMKNVVQFALVKQKLNAAWDQTKGTERLIGIESFNLTRPRVEEADVPILLCDATACRVLRCGRCGATSCGAVRCGASGRGAVLCSAMRCDATRCDGARCASRSGVLVPSLCSPLCDDRKRNSRRLSTLPPKPSS